MSLVEGPVFRSTQQMTLPVTRMTVPVYMGVSTSGMENSVTRDVHHYVSTKPVTEMTVVVILTVDILHMGVASKFCSSCSLKNNKWIWSKFQLSTVI